MSDIPGFAAPCYHSLTQPHLMAGVARNFFICDVVAMMVWGLWCLVYPALWPGVLLGLAVYVVVWCGTKYDTEFFDILIEHVGHAHHYEG